MKRRFALLVALLFIAWIILVARPLFAPEYPVGVWVQVSPNTFVKNEGDGTLSFRSELSAEHPCATWRWEK